MGNCHLTILRHRRHLLQAKWNDDDLVKDLETNVTQSISIKVREKSFMYHVLVVVRICCLTGNLCRQNHHLRHHFRRRPSPKILARFGWHPLKCEPIPMQLLNPMNKWMWIWQKSFEMVSSRWGSRSIPYLFGIEEWRCLANVAHTTSSSNAMYIIIDAFRNVKIDDMQHTGDVWKLSKTKGENETNQFKLKPTKMSIAYPNHVQPHLLRWVLSFCLFWNRPKLLRAVTVCDHHESRSLDARTPTRMKPKSPLYVSFQRTPLSRVDRPRSGFPSACCAFQTSWPRTRSAVRQSKRHQPHRWSRRRTGANTCQPGAECRWGTWPRTWASGVCWSVASMGCSWYLPLLEQNPCWKYDSKMNEIAQRQKKTKPQFQSNTNLLQHTISFIQHEVFQVVKCDVCFVAEIFQTTRSRNQNVATLLQIRNHPKNHSKSYNLRCVGSMGFDIIVVVLNLHWKFGFDGVPRFHHTIGNTWWCYLWQTFVPRCKSECTIHEWVWRSRRTAVQH